MNHKKPTNHIIVKPLNITLRKKNENSKRNNYRARFCSHPINDGEFLIRNCRGQKENCRGQISNAARKKVATQNAIPNKLSLRKEGNINSFSERNSVSIRPTLKK